MPQRPYRPRGNRDIILIQCEGLRTEYTYLDDFCRDCDARRRLTIDVNPGKGQNALVTVQTAIAKARTERTRGKIYNEIWCVLDVEHAAHVPTLTQALAFAERHNIKVCLSNPSFEVWLLAHFEQVTDSFADSAAAERRLSERHWRKHFSSDYDKSDPRLYERLQPRLPDALDSAQWTLKTFHQNQPCRHANASTEVYKLINRLLPPDVASKDIPETA